MRLDAGRRCEWVSHRRPLEPQKRPAHRARLYPRAIAPLSPGYNLGMDRRSVLPIAVALAAVGAALLFTGGLGPRISPEAPDADPPEGGPAAPPPTGEDPAGEVDLRSVTGLVLDDETRRPVRGAEITIPVGPGSGIATSTDARGEWTAAIPVDLPPGTELRATAPGYVPGRRSREAARW